MNLDEIEARAKAANVLGADAALVRHNELWSVRSPIGGWGFGGRGTGPLEHAEFGIGEWSKACAEFYLHARQDIPALIAELRALRSENERLERDLDRATAFVNDVAIGLNAARSSAGSIGDGVARTWDVSLLLAAAERCAAALEKSP